MPSILDVIRDPKKGGDLLTSDAVSLAGEACVTASKDLVVKAVVISSVIALVIGGLVGYSIKS